MNEIINNNQINEEKQITISTSALVKDISQLIDEARGKVSREYNATQVQLCWLIGRRIDEEILKFKRAQYGDQIVANISSYLTTQYGRGYSRPNLFKMLKFSKLFNDSQIVSTLSRQLCWSHFVLLCTIEDGLKRDFYAEMCRLDNWSVRKLKKQIDGMLYERTAISKKPEELIRHEIDKLQENELMTPALVFKDPYFLDFIGLKPSYSEEELEDAILNQITEFLQELGTDFCFVARQKRMSISKKDRYLDLLFYNRSLQRLIAVDLKIGEFDPAYKGQMEWYLRWLDKNERKPWEKEPLGIILCAGKDEEDIEYLELDKSGIHIAQYFTELPPKELLEEKLRQAIHIAKENYIKKKLYTE